jgi:4-hydroxy-2-oxoheptanedioate aldolase
LEVRLALRDTLESGQNALGVMISFADPFACEIVARSGFDWACIDQQHGMAGPDRLLALLQAFAITGTPVLVRVAWNEPSAIMRALDAGAAGVVVPMVESAQHAASAVAACRYPPLGARSWGPTRASLGAPGYSVRSANRDVLCAVMIETQRGVECLDEIVAVPGVDIVFIGPADLAIAYGGAPSLFMDGPEIPEQIERVHRAATDRGVIPAIFASSPQAAKRFIDAGFRLLTIASDRALLSDAARSAVAEMRQS